MSLPRFHRLPPSLLAMLLGLAMASCGGDSQPGSTPQTEVPTSPGLTVDCEGLRCGATDAHRYAGAGVAVWQYTNATAANVEVPVRIDGIPGRDVQLVFANLGKTPQSMPPLALAARSPYPVDLLPAPAQVSRASVSRLASIRPAARLNAGHRQHPASRLSDVLHRATAVPEATAPHDEAPGSTRTWLVQQSGDVMDVSERRVTLARRQHAPDGRVVNLWMEDGQLESGLVTAGQLDKLIERFAVGPASIYARVSDIAGPPWGPHSRAGLIPADQPLDIVFVTGIASMAQAYVRIDDFPLRPTDPAPDDPRRTSNAALSIVMSVETLYTSLYPRNYEPAASVLAHEMTHLANVYRRGIQRGDDDYRHAVWLEETTALMMQDILFDPERDTLHEIRDSALFAWMVLGSEGGFNCDLARYSNDPSELCVSFPVQGAFGAYLLRHYGLAFYRDLLRNMSSTDSWEVLNDAIRQAGGPGLTVALRRFSAAIALLPAGTSPPGYGFPERRESGYTLVPLDGSLDADTPLPGSLPEQLVPHGFFATARPNMRGTYLETITVPPGTALSVVVR